MGESPTTTTIAPIKIPTLSKVFEPPLLEQPPREQKKLRTLSLSRKSSVNFEKGLQISNARTAESPLSKASNNERKLTPSSDPDDYDIDVRFGKDEIEERQPVSKLSPSKVEDKPRISNPRTKVDSRKVSNKIKMTISKQSPTKTTDQPRISNPKTKVDSRNISNEIKMKARDLSRSMLSEKDMKELGGLLYRFNYTLKYNGHNENGYLSGAKDGKYFILGEDGIKRLIEYMANEFGYQPHIKLEDLKESSLSDENNLLGYEFMWLNE